MHQTTRNLLLVGAGVFALSTSLSSMAFADPPPWANGGHQRDEHQSSPHRPEDRGGDHRADSRDNQYQAPRRDNYQISTREQMYINDWYRRNLPPGLAKQGKIPPGHAKKLERGAPWPPPYAYEPLPYDLRRNLSPLPPGYAYYRVGADVIIANIAGRVVSDVVYDLLNR
ncbi:MAG: hypothetical protein B7Y07_07585 [Halothiobacillus sp. 24-54-40]|jgi:Ni/Co efflux regulator RcnB|nr:MAG: hypothetical protein B7Y58_07310 [Halothiobacillus sp. 35-54-62]OYZ86605.1 MAG: hypothetical protein B7Y07_07585 [Halothiobacillus sp. 24-54-40]OZA79990.1 MAG: hypothetical protein B7X64_07745 [Halothiobacillus sp. 39-53-45]HQS03454.1 hypothetical protein [Halothiobacillus sp.]HQS29868.1 hypothetical protein [Halothiobacillus sp.]